MPATKILIDADTGIDDALAILYALRSPLLKIEGITTVFGNTDTAQAAENTLRLLELADPGCTIPVVVGADKPLVRERDAYSTHVHGENGIGGIELPPVPRGPLAETAAEFIVRKAEEMPGELTLVTLGCLTNVALALALDPALPGKLKGIVAMGGTVLVPGNVTPVAEANFYKDPEAAEQVLASGVPFTMVGLDVTLQTRIGQRHLDYLDRYGREDAEPVTAFMQTALQQYFRFYRTTNHFFEEAPLHDPLAVMVAADPSLVSRRRVKARIECEGKYTTGMVVADLRNTPRVGSDIDVCLEVLAERAVGEFLSVFL